MDDEIQLISDGDGLAVIGEPRAVERFLASEQLPSKDLGLPRLGNVLRAGSATAQGGSELAAGSGRWVKLTKESAQSVKKFGLRKNAKTGLDTGVVKGVKGGQVGGFVEFVKRPEALLTNPAVLAGAAGIMAQLAMQQTMDEITDYLATIDEKLDDVLRAHKDAVVADMIGVDLVIEEAMTIREHGHRVNEVTWSKAQGTSATIARTQAYALRQLDALADKVERKSRIGELADTFEESEFEVREWLAVLARCFQLQDAIAVLELDRVLDAAPDDLDGHRLGLKASRQKRLNAIALTTERLLTRVAAAADTANVKVLLHPSKSPAVVQSSNLLAIAVSDFYGGLGIDRDRQSTVARRWVDAATEARERAFESGSDGVDAAKRFGNSAFDRARSASGRVAERARRRRGDKDDHAEKD